MAHRVARPAQYQGGASFNVFSAQGSNPTGDCKVSGKGVQKIYDKSVKTYVYSLCGGPTSKLQLPKDENKTGLQLLHPFVVFQIFVPISQPLAFELRVTDTSNTRRKMYFSTSFSDIKSTPLHCQIPISMVTRGIWLSLSIHIVDLFAHCFKGMVFKSVDTILLGPVCKLRKIFTMRNRLSNVGSLSNSFDVNNEDYLPPEHMFALGVKNLIQVVDIMALKLAIADLSDPSHGTKEDTLKLRKIKLNKLESRQVHVAFGSRIPLPLSTIQINTSLLGDNKSHSNKVFSEEQEQVDRTNRSNHSQIDIPISISKQNQVENKVENKSETLQNLLKHANNFNKNHAILKLKKDQILLDPRFKLPIINEHVERSHNVHFTNHEFQLPQNVNITGAYKQTPKTEVGIGGIMTLTSLTKDDMMNMLSKEDPIITHLEWSSDEVCPNQMPRSNPINNEVSNGETLEANVHKVLVEDPQTYVPKKIEEYKLPDPIIRLGKYGRKCFHGDINKKKEIKQSKYMDSPPESPPCGWTSCIEDDSEEEPLKIPSFFSKNVDGMDELERSKDSIGIRSTMYGNSHSMDSSNLEDEGRDDAQSIEEGIQNFLSDEDAKTNYSSKKTNFEKSMKDTVRSTFESIDNFREDQQRPAGIAHEKFDLGNDDNFRFHDSEITGPMSDEDYSFGRHSWSSNDHSQHEQDGDQFLITNARSLKISYDSSQESLSASQDSDQKINDSIDQSIKFLNEYIDGHNSFESSDIIRDDHIENLRQSPIITRPQSKTSYKCNEDALNGMLTSSSDSIESISKHSISSFTLENKHKNVKAIEISNCIVEHEDAGITINNGRPDEDLDLLYDPTLDCYYDPKTNRYYELK